MTRTNFAKPGLLGSILLTALLSFSISSCSVNDVDANGDSGELINAQVGVVESFDNGEVVFLLLDEDAIDNGNEPNNFSDTEVNDHLADIGQRRILEYFKDNVGEVITLYSGQVGDEGWFALKTIPNSWMETGPTDNGLRNYLTPGPGLGASGDDPEVLLDEIPDVTPLRATGIKMLQGQTIYAVVYDSDISINYNPIEGNLQGANLGIVAFDVLDVTEISLVDDDSSTSDLPSVSIRIRDAMEIGDLTLSLFSNAPVLESSSEPFDIVPPTNPQPIVLHPAP